MDLVISRVGTFLTHTMFFIDVLICVAFILFSMYNNVVMRCFDACVHNFRSKTLDTSEVKCTEQCAERYIKLTQRVGLRFAEHQALQQKRMEDSAAKN